MITYTRKNIEKGNKSSLKSLVNRAKNSKLAMRNRPNYVFTYLSVLPLLFSFIKDTPGAGEFSHYRSVSLHLSPGFFISANQFKSREI